MIDVPSPFASYLGTNYAATGDEAKKLANYLTEPIAQLVQLKDEIKSMQEHQDAVQKQHDALSRRIDEHRALTAPIRHLPIDVIQEIFMRCLPQTHNSIMNKDHCPVLLTRICSHWRHIALNTATLWSSIHVPIPSYTFLQPWYPVSDIQQVTGDDPIASAQKAAAVTTATCRAEGIKEWLGRSGSCSLDITLHNSSDSTQSEVYDIIISAVVLFCERWGSLICDKPASAYLQRVANLPIGLLPRLHTITIVAYNSWGAEPFWTQSTLLQAPNIKHLEYQASKQDPDDFSAFPLRWAQLSSLTLMGVSMLGNSKLSTPKIGQILASCPLLQSCYLEFIPGDPYSPDDSPMIQNSTLENSPMPTSIRLPQLTELIVDGPIELSLNELFDALDVPILEVFCAQKGTLKYPLYHMTATASFLAFLTRTAHTLKRILINPLLFFPEEFFGFISACEHLIELELSAIQPFRLYLAGETRQPLQVNNQFLHRLLEVPPDSNEEQIFLPRLSVFKCRPFADFTGECVFELLKARKKNRNNGVAKLRTVQVFFLRPQTAPLLDEIKMFAEEGVHCLFDFPHVSPKTEYHNPATQGISVIPPEISRNQYVY